MEQIPQVSIVMPTYNRVGFLRRAIESIFTQTFQDWELIVVDDASTDETPSVLAAFAAKDKRVVVLRNETNYYPDISKTLNKGLAAARGKYIARLDDDDYWLDPDKLKKQHAFLESHPDYVVVGSGMIVVDGEGKELYRYLKRETDKQIRKTALFANPFSHTTVMFRADVARRVHGYGTWRYAEDWDLWLKLGNEGKLYNFPEYSAAYTMAGQNKSFVHQRAQSRMTLEFIKAHKREYPGYWRARAVNTAQYLFSFLPLFVRRSLHTALSSLKRRSF
jgi:glycosyltransferase involved in cell wall biosynthesis